MEMIKIIYEDVGLECCGIVKSYTHVFPSIWV
jgi:hypothetical protein